MAHPDTDPARPSTTATEIIQRLKRIEAGQRQQRALISDLVMSLGAALKELRETINGD